ncbi:MAG TPA: phenylalanine--tRNA ligase subunit alpha, partial [Bacteroidetes bacterium]|nr:phenylalanine--tRNA ligase subunit alpha [Bacteroidota bacterium]
MLEKKISELQAEVDKLLPIISSIEDLEKFRIEFLSRSGKLASLYDDLKNTPNDKKPFYGQKI